jgi:hypothetical protein
MQTYKAILIETSIAATLSLAAAALLSPSDLGVGTLFPHPVWLAVAVVAARYGTRGMSVSVPLTWGALTLAALAMRIPVAEVMARLTTGSDVGALIAVVLVAAVASIHERRFEHVNKTMEAFKERCAADRAAVKELREAAVVLRNRADRLETSLTFLREVASRLEGSDPTAAAQAALELAVARLGARAGTAQAVDGAALRPVASVGTWSPDGGPMDLSRDQTVAAALRKGRPARAFDLSEVRPGDSDLAAPVMDARGAVCGILALRGVPHGGASASGLHELALIAAWCGRSFAGSARRLFPEAGPLTPPRLDPSRGVSQLEPPRPDAVIESDLAEGLAESPVRSISQINI